jgi:peptidyl-Lys metalloendopeptidase
MTRAILVLAGVTALLAASGAPRAETRFEGCSGKQRVAAANALVEAQALSAAALEALRDPRRVRRLQRGQWELWRVWFGEGGTERYARVERVLSGVHARLAQGARLEVRCGGAAFACREGARAFASFGFPYLGLCPAFFAEGVDRPALVVHELTHLTADTRDYTYADARTRDLARRHADRAVRNAESYEAFVAALAGRRPHPDPDLYDDEGG